jgi:ribose transport system substrate-binding protein
MFVALLVLVAILVTPSTAPAKAPTDAGHGAQFHFAWLANDPANTYDNAIRLGIESVAARSHSTVDAFFAGFDPATQLAQCGAAVSSGDYDALIVMAASATEIVPCVEQARDAGIPVAAVDLPIGEDPTTVQPQVDGVVAAVHLTAPYWGAAVSEILPQACAGLDPCDVFYLAGISSFPFDQFGLQAIAAAASATPSIVLAGDGEAFYDTNVARDVVAQALTEQPEIDVVIAAGDQMALGAEQAAADAGVPVRIVGAGAGASALDAVREGRWFATASALPFTEGQIGTRLLVRALRVRHAEPVGVDPVQASGLPVWWTQQTLSAYPDFAGEWPGP